MISGRFAFALLSILEDRFTDPAIDKNKAWIFDVVDVFARAGILR
jgi:hypothetical protein